MKLYFLAAGVLLSLGSASAQVFYKDTGLAPDMCVVNNVVVGTTQEYFINSVDSNRKVEEPYSEGCLTLKTIYVNNLLTALELNFGETKNCDFKGRCGVLKGSDEITKTYNELTNYLAKTKKADIRAALKNDNQNIGALIINQVQHMAQLRYKEDSVYDLQQLAKVNANINQAFGLNLNLQVRHVDKEKTQACMDYSLICPMQMADPARATEKCKTMMKNPAPAHCAQAAAASSQAAVASAVQDLTDGQAEEYLSLNLDVKKAFESKPASDKRSKTQFASQHYRDFSEAEGRPISVKEYLNCNPDVAYAFNDPAMNTNQDEAKTNIVAFVAKHFQYLIQPIVPVSSRNFKTHGCIDLEKYLACHADVKTFCSAQSNGDRDFLNKIKICAIGHYINNGKKEGRTDTCDIN